MRSYSSRRPWFTVVLAIVVLAAAVYVPYAYRSAWSPGGGTVLGLAFGVAGYALMIYAALLGLRKKFPLWRVGRASTWMRGHLWLGFLSFPLLLVHSAFAAEGWLPPWLMTVRM